MAAATKQNIRELIGDGSLDASTRLVLTNAIYFKGKWLSEFRKRATKDEPFTQSDGVKMDVPLMRQVGIFAYHDNGHLQVLELPYAGDELTMMVVLPRSVDGLPKVEESLTAEVIADWGKAVHRTLTYVLLPRFKAETQYELSEPLAGLGMRACFSAAADLGGAFQSDEPLFISLAIHKAFVEVNDEGTEAAGATALAVEKTVERAPEPQPKVFRADHPFLFLIRHNVTKSILFLGRCAGPM